jgi:hypothetical protein
MPTIEASARLAVQMVAELHIRAALDEAINRIEYLDTPNPRRRGGLIPELSPRGRRRSDIRRYLRILRGPRTRSVSRWRPSARWVRLRWSCGDS